MSNNKGIFYKVGIFLGGIFKKIGVIDKDSIQVKSHQSASGIISTNNNKSTGNNPNSQFIACPYCKEKCPPGSVECPNPRCGMFLPEEYWPVEKRTKTESLQKKFCFACGQEIDARAEICPKCGVRQPGMEIKSTTEVRLIPERKSYANRRTAGLFAIFLGGLGVHKFYLGQVGKGFAYLIFCWTFIPAILGLIEGIDILRMSDSEFNSTYE